MGGVKHEPEVDWLHIKIKAHNTINLDAIVHRF